MTWSRPQVYARIASILIIAWFATASATARDGQGTLLDSKLWPSCGVQDDVLSEVLEDLEVDRFSLKADEVASVTSQVSNLIGNVELTGPGFKIATESVQYDESEKFVKTDALSFIHRDIVATGASIEFFVERGTASLTDTRLYLSGNGFRGEAETIQLSADELVLEGVGITTCNPERAAWFLSADQIRIDRANQVAVAKRTKLELGDVPVIFIPYLRLPATGKRLSGLLMPSIGRSTEDGFKAKFPLYLNLAPNYDLTLSPSFTSRRGTKVEGEFRHIAASMQNDIKFLYSPGDRRYSNELARRESASGNSSDRRWRLNVEHEGVYGNWRSAINTEAASDELLARDLGRSILDITSVGTAEVASLRRVSSNSVIRLGIHEFQPYDDWSSVHRFTPRLDSSWSQRLGPLDLKIYGSFSSLMSRTSSIETNVRRGHTEISVSAPFSRNWGHLTLEGTQRNSWYDFDDRSESRSVASYALSGSLIFEKNIDFRDDLALQTLEPIFLVQSWNVGNQDFLPNFDSVERTPSFEKLFDARRYTGYDRYADNDVVSIGVVSRLLDLSSGLEKLNLSVGIRRPFGESEELDEEITRAGLGLETAINPNVSIEAFLLSPRFESLSKEAALRGRFRSGNPGDYELTLGVRMSDDMRQFEVSASTRLTDRWRAYLHTYRNQRENQNIESFFGLEYLGCCVQLRVLWRETIYPSFGIFDAETRNRGFLVEFSLTGLGSIGDEVSSILEQQLIR